MSAITKPKFEIGQLVATPSTMEALSRNGTDDSQYVNRHRGGDWGDVNEDDARANEAALTQDLPILSAYTLKDSTRIWIITEGDRSATTILLPEEY
jgi:hypothetical protein